MLLSRPLNMLAVAAGAGSMMLAVLCSTAQAQRPTYRNISHQHSSAYQTASHGCPCPCPSGEATPAPEDGTAVPTPEGEDLPEVADLTGDAGFASAPQSAVPNAIGDTMGGCFSAYTLGGEHYPVCPSSRRFKISENNSALPQHRVYYNFNYFDSALYVDDGTNENRLNVHRHTFGVEYAFWCDMASFGVEVPFQNGINPEYDGGDITSTEFENISLIFKSVLYQDCCKTLSAGLGVDLPTGPDTSLDDGGTTFDLENDVVILSPYVALLRADPCGCNFMHAFVQVDLPTDDYTVDANGAVGEIDAGTLLHIDLSVGRWIHQDCCGNGLAVIAELHYSENLESAQTIGTGDTLSSSDNEFFNATLGANVARGCWDIRPAVVLPLLDRPDRGFDYELSLQINRRF